MDCNDGHNVFFSDIHNNVTAAFSLNQNLGETLASNLCNEVNDSTSMDIHIENESSPYVTCDQVVQTDIKKFTSKKTQTLYSKGRAGSYKLHFLYQLLYIAIIKYGEGQLRMHNVRSSMLDTHMFLV